MILVKTDKARAELRPGTRTLAQRERTILLLADGSKSLEDMRGLFEGEGHQLTRRLIDDGYLVQSTAEAFSPNRTGAFQAHSTGAFAPQSTGAFSPNSTGAFSPSLAPAGADSFEGKRSLATTRMFLFDICERMFARRDPAKAHQFREALRQAKDRESMLAAGRDMIAEIEVIAGAERADSISERIAMLLPPEAA